MDKKKNIDQSTSDEGVQLSGFNSLKRKLYIVALLAVVIALFTTHILTDQMEMYERYLYGIFLLLICALTIVLIFYKQFNMRMKIIEYGVLISIVSYLAARLYMYDFTTMDFAYTYWAPVLYIFVFITFSSKVGLYLSVIVFLILFAAGTFNVDFSSLESVDRNRMIQFYLSNINYILLLFVLQYLRNIYLEATHLKLMANTDFLTDVYNRRYMHELIGKQLEQHKESGQSCAVILFDLDHFKHVNDQYGHEIGDRVLIDVVNVIQKVMPTTCTLSRWGGEEFVIYIPQANLQQSLRLSEVLRKEIETHDFMDINSLTSSFGIAVSHKEDTVESILKRADDALYAAKSKGRNCSEYIA